MINHLANQLLSVSFTPAFVNLEAIYGCGTRCDTANWYVHKLGPDWLQQEVIANFALFMHSFFYSIWQTQIKFFLKV